MENTISVSKALVQLKMLDKRINRAIQESVLGGYMIGKKPMTGYNNAKEIEERSKSDYQSITDLIRQRNRIKSAIVVSNATTNVQVAGRIMTVAEAIERKSAIEYEKNLLNKMKQTYTSIVNKVDTVNEDVKNRLDKHLEVLFGKEGKTKAQENDEIIKSFLQENEAKMIDPLNLKQKIENLEAEIEEFESDVDQALTESNVITKITIEN